MINVCGYILILPEDRIQLFLDRVEEGTSFAQPVSDFYFTKKTPLICLVVNKNKITHIALGRQGMRSGTELRRLNLSKVEKTSEPIGIVQVISHLPGVHKGNAKKYFDSGGLIGGEKCFLAIIDAIRQLVPHPISIFERYCNEQRNQRINQFSGEVKQNLAYQKESVLTALFIAGIDRDPVHDWSPQDTAPISFLDGLSVVRLREDQMVLNDMMKIPGFDLVKSHMTGTAIFRSDRERLAVILANRLPLEQQTGTDLIYFNETFRSFILVQYKAMEDEKDANGKKQAVFRLPNKQLEEEITRMDVLLSQLNSCELNTIRDGFRLTENPFFLKLCPRFSFDPDSTELIKGMYLPLEYWKLLIKDSSIKGTQGGLRVTFENVGRHMDNTNFVNIISKAWVGTTPSQTAVLEKLIYQILESGKAIAFAAKSGKRNESSMGHTR